MVRGRTLGLMGGLWARAVLLLLRRRRRKRWRLVARRVAGRRLDAAV